MRQEKKKTMKIVAFWVLLILIFAVASSILEFMDNEQLDLNYSDVMDLVEQNKIAKVEIRNDEIIGETKEGKSFEIDIPREDPELIKTLRARNVEVSVNHPSGFAWLNLIYIAIFIFLGYFIIRGFNKGKANDPRQFGKSKVKFLDKNSRRTRFSDVAGMEEIAKEVQEIVEMQKNIDNYRKLNAKPIKAVLLTGPPGTGKTLLARAIAGEANVPFLSISGSEYREISRASH